MKLGKPLSDEYCKIFGNVAQVFDFFEQLYMQDLFITRSAGGFFWNFFLKNKTPKNVTTQTWLLGCCGVLQCVAVCCSVLLCAAVCCSVPCVAVCCSVLQCLAVCRVLQCVAVCRSVPCVAMCCGVLPCVAEECDYPDTKKHLMGVFVGTVLMFCYSQMCIVIFL